MTVRSEIVALLLLSLVATAAQAQGGDHEGEVALRLRTSPDGAQVTLVEPETRELGVTPIRYGWVPTGPVRLRFELGGHQTQEIDIDAIRRETIDVTLVAAPEVPDVAAPGPPDLQPETTEATPQLMVRGTPAGARVLVDGQFVGELPEVVVESTVGPHEVRVIEPGHRPETQVVTVYEVGGLLEVALRPDSGSIEIAVAGAAVTVDGEPREATLTLADVPPGDHSVEVQLGGQRGEAGCSVRGGEACRVTVALAAPQGTLRVTADREGARVSVDSEPVGPAPWEGPLAHGAHVVEVSAPGARSDVATVVVGTESATHHVTLEDVEPPDGGEGAGATVRSVLGATPMDRGSMAATLSGGYPWLGELGVLFALDRSLATGLAVRSFGRLSELELRVRYVLSLHSILFVGAGLRVAGGVGPDGTNSVSGSVEGLVTARPWDRLAVGALVALDLSSDRYGFTALDSSAQRPALYEDDRQNMLRLRVGATVDLMLTERWSLFGGVDWIVLDGSDGDEPETTRAVLGDLFGSGRTDPRLYGRLGVALWF